MGTVYLGRREGLGGFSRLVALKRAHPDLASKPSVQRRFVREANAASMLHHANVVAVVDLFTKDGDSWLVLDWVDGVSLADLVSDRGQLPIRVATHIILDACAGLAAAHELRVDDAPLGLQHRDVSPGNILVGRDGVSRIADFGLARTFDTTLTNTDDRFLEGKLGYLAPELFQGKDFDERCDLYALGVVAWEAASGMRLFRAKTLTKLMAEQRAPTRLAAIYPSLAWLDPLIDRAMAFDPAKRASSVREFMNELAQAADKRGALGTANDVAQFMLAAEVTGTPIAELSAKTPVATGMTRAERTPEETGLRALQSGHESVSFVVPPLRYGMLEPTPTTGPLVREIDASSAEVSSDDIAIVPALSQDVITASAPITRSAAMAIEADEPDAPTPPPPNRISSVSLSAVADAEPRSTIESAVVAAPLTAGSFLASSPKTSTDDPVSFDSFVAVPKPRAGLWLAGLVGVSVLSVALIAATRSDEPPNAVGGAATVGGASSTGPPAPTIVSSPLVATAPRTAIVIGPDEARSARVRGVGTSATTPTAPSAAADPRPLVVPPVTTSTATGNTLPDNPYRKKTP